MDRSNTARPGRRAFMLGASALAASAGLRGRAAAAEVVAGGAPVHWEQAGAGRRTLVFVHGWTCDSTNWSGQVPAFAAANRVLTLDLPGHGRSAQPAAGYSMSGFAGAVEAVRAAAGADRIVLVGHSMGGPVIRRYALTYPQRVEAMVLVDGLVQDPATPMPPAPPRPMTGAEGMKARVAMVEGMFVAGTPPPVREQVRRIMLGAPEATAAGAMAATQDRAAWSDRPITVPVLGVYAEGSRLGPAEARRKLYPTMQYEELPGTGHFLMMEQPAAFNARLQAFLAKLG